MLAKKPKVVSNVATILNRGVASASAGPSVSLPQSSGADAWESVAIDAEPSELVPEVLKANDLTQTEKVVCIFQYLQRELLTFLDKKLVMF